MPLSLNVIKHLQDIRAALNTIDDAIEDLVGMGSPETKKDGRAVDMLTHHQDNIQEFLDDVETHLGIPQPMCKWDAALTRAIDAGDTQLILKLDARQYLLVPFENIKGHLVLHFGVADAGKIVVNPAPLSKDELYSSFQANGYSVDDNSAWRSTLADAEKTWAGAWAANQEWNETHVERGDQIQAQLSAGMSAPTTLFINRVAGGLYRPGYHTQGHSVITSDTAIDIQQIPAWYAERNVLFSFDFAWEIAPR